MSSDPRSSFGFPCPNAASFNTMTGVLGNVAEMEPKSPLIRSKVGKTWRVRSVCSRWSRSRSVRWNKSPPAPLPETVGIGFLRSGTSFTSLTAETSLLVFMRVSHLESRVAEVSVRRRWLAQPRGAAATRRGRHPQSSDGITGC